MQKGDVEHLITDPDQSSDRFRYQHLPASPFSRCFFCIRLPSGLLIMLMLGFWLHLFEAADAFSATLIIESRPSGAAVICNGKAAGKTGLTIDDAAPYEPFAVQIIHDDTRLEITIQYLCAGERIRMQADFESKNIRFGDTLSGHLVFLGARVKNGWLHADRIIEELSDARKAEIGRRLNQCRFAEKLKASASYSEKRNIDHTIVRLKDRLGVLRWTQTLTVKVLEYIYGNTSGTCWLAKTKDGQYIEFEDTYKTAGDEARKNEWVKLYLDSEVQAGSPCVFSVACPEKHLQKKYGITDACRHHGNIVKIEKQPR